MFLLYFSLFFLLAFKFSSSNTAFSCTRREHFFIFLFLRQSISSYRQIIPKTSDKYLKKEKEREKRKKLKGFPGGSAGNESTCNAGDPSSIPGSERSPGKGRGYPLQYSWASLVSSMVKNPPAWWETWVQSLGWEDPLETGKAIHSSIQPCISPWHPKKSDRSEQLLTAHSRMNQLHYSDEVETKKHLALS